jgi:hypothetical protein
MSHGPDYIPSDEIDLQLAREYRRTGAVLRNVRKQLATGELDALLARPVEAILDRVLRESPSF